MGFIKFLIIFFAIFLLARLVLRLLLPSIFRIVVRKTASSFHTHQQQSPHNKPPHSRKRQGEIHVEYIPEDKQRQRGDQAGEFVEFEELKEK